MKCLNGDLNQMYTQKDILEKRGIPVSVSGGIPMVNSINWEKALLIIWHWKIEGWWNYENDLISLGICAKEEYEKELMRD